VIINRHNYEEFFLLYVDNELSEADRAAVELFVQQNPDLAEEMEMMKHAVLPTEIIAFEDKEKLYNKAGGITSHNYEEYFLLSVDQELTQQESEEVEKFVLKHPELQNEFTLLQLTRVEAEEIGFPGKEKLFKYEAKERRVIFVNWMRMSAAAAIIGLAAITWFFSEKNTNKAPNSFVATNYNSIKRLPQTIQQVKPGNSVTDKRVAAVQNKIVARVGAATKSVGEVVKANAAKETRDVAAVAAVREKPVKKVGPSLKVEKVAELPLQDRQAFEEAIASAKIDKNNSSSAINNDPKETIVANKSSVEETHALAAHAVYKEINTQEDDEEKSIYIGSAQINKNKLKGLFKKATSFLGVRSNNNDGERTLKIAGFEIKSK
jgi:hypothetical protein